jgi:NADH-quinone oxidoreductase subunit F
MPEGASEIPDIIERFARRRLLTIATLSPEEIVDRLERSGLRGRGGAWFPAARKWRAVRTEAADSGATPVVVGNGAEGEPGSIKDRHVMTTRSAEVVAGLAVAARAVGADEAIVYVKGSFGSQAEALESAIARASLDGLRMRVHRGADSYVAGEETALLESLEGRRAWPRTKPPLPYAAGYGGRPTLVQNVETLSRVVAAITDPEAFRSSETTLVSLWGHVRRPGVYEVRLGATLREIIDEHGGGPTETVRAVFPGGPSTPALSSDQLDTRLDPEALREAGSALGTAAMLVIGESTCPVSVAASLAGFFEREACGQCPPCVVGTQNLARIVRLLAAGKARGSDLSHLDEAAGFMAHHGYCAHSRTAAAAVTGLLRRFHREVEEHVTGGPRRGRHADPFGTASPERAAIESQAAS